MKLYLFTSTESKRCRNPQNVGSLARIYIPLLWQLERWKTNKKAAGNLGLHPRDIPPIEFGLHHFMSFDWDWYRDISQEIFFNMNRTSLLKNETQFSTDRSPNVWQVKESQRGQIGPPKNLFSFSPNPSNHIQIKLFMSPLDENMKNFLNGPNYQLLFLDL